MLVRVVRAGLVLNAYAAEPSAFPKVLKILRGKRARKPNNTRIAKSNAKFTSGLIGTRSEDESDSVQSYSCKTDFLLPEPSD